MWSNDQTVAYEWVKKAIVSGQVLVHYNPKSQVILSCDASKYELGAWLAHEIKIYNKRAQCPIAFTRMKLKEAEV